MDQLSLLPAAPQPFRRAAARTTLERIFRDEWRAYPGRCDLIVLEGLARDAYAHAGLAHVLRVNPLWLLRRHGLRWRIGHPVGSTGAQLVNHALVVYRAGLRGRALGLALLHEFAHWLLDEHHRHDHDQRDVWLLTILLAFPGTHLHVVRREGWTLDTLARYQPHAERWALQARAWIARKLSSAA